MGVVAIILLLVYVSVVSRVAVWLRPHPARGIGAGHRGDAGTVGEGRASRPRSLDELIADDWADRFSGKWLVYAYVVDSEKYSPIGWQ